MRNESIESARRFQFGLKGVVGGIGTRGVAPTVGEGEHWKGARTVIRTDENRIESTEILPQVGARFSLADAIEWVLEKDLTAEFAARYLKGSQFMAVGGKSMADNERLLEKLKAVCPTFVYGGVINSP